MTSLHLLKSGSSLKDCKAEIKTRANILFTGRLHSPHTHTCIARVMMQSIWNLLLCDVETNSLCTLMLSRYFHKMLRLVTFHFADYNTAFYHTIKHLKISLSFIPTHRDKMQNADLSITNISGLSVFLNFLWSALITELIAWLSF